ncbi:hypothetical protein ACEPPN_015931 [Leptodophora sp. 'Broadleaf-Isolate-01']
MAASFATKMTMKDVKVIHAQVQSQVVRNAMANRVSRGPVTLGELCDTLFKERTDFDPYDHCFPSLPRDFFLRMTAADRSQVAWNFIQQSTSTVRGAIDSMHFRSTSAESSNPIFSSNGTDIGHAAPPPTATGEGYNEPRPTGYDMVTGIEINTHLVVNHEIEHNATVQNGSTASTIPHRTSYQHPPAQLGTPLNTNLPYVISIPVVQAPYVVYQVAPAVVPQGFYDYPVGPMVVEKTGSSFAKSIVPVPSFPLPQGSGQKINPAPVIHLQFATSRHRMDKERSLSIETAQRAIMAGLNPFSNYKGDFTEEMIRHAQCPDELNTSVHIEGFPVGTSEADILSVIRFAAVRNICIHPAVPGRFTTAAADITFFKREAAEYCFDRGAEGNFKFRGKTLKFLWNKNKCRPADAEEMRQSRVLVIEGPEHVVSIQAVESLLHEKLVFKLVERKTWRAKEGKMIIWLEFCKVRGQARCAKKLLEEVIIKADLDVVVSFGEDPCGPR